MKTAIIGSRNLNPVISLDFTPIRIISGGAAGVDTQARNYAIDNNIELVEILPQYAKFGRSAPIIRNKEIVDSADIVVAYWDGISKGTKMVIDYAKKKNKDVKIILLQ